MRAISGSPKTGHSARKASDEFTVPLCGGHHREVHPKISCVRGFSLFLGVRLDF
jgi:hypothetical protein